MEFKLSGKAEFAMPVYGGVFNIFEWVASGGDVNPKRIERGMHLPTQFQVVEFVKALFVPFVSLYQVLNTAYPKSKTMKAVTSAFYGLLFITWIALFISSGTYTAMLAWGWAIMFSAAVLLAFSETDSASASTSAATSGLTSSPRASSGRKCLPRCAFIARTWACRRTILSKHECLSCE
jgi:hypothetical protein